MSWPDTVIIRSLGLKDYSVCWQAMKEFTDKRTQTTLDELWIVQHPPVFTQGQSGKPEHVLNSKDIPVLQVDRGGQVTYHGPGQLIIYVMVDLKRKKFNVRQIVTCLEKSVIELLVTLQLTASTKCNAPGVYVGDKKICSLGLRIRRGCSFHGLALNIDMDLEPFQRINPCGYPGLKMTQIAEYIKSPSLTDISSHLLDYLIKNLGYTKRQE